MGVEKTEIVAPVVVKLHDVTITNLRRLLVEAGRTLAGERRDGFRYAIKLIEEELLQKRDGYVAPWRVERVLERLRDLSEMEGD